MRTIKYVLSVLFVPYLLHAGPTNLPERLIRSLSYNTNTLVIVYHRSGTGDVDNVAFWGAQADALIEVLTPTLATGTPVYVEQDLTALAEIAGHTNTLYSAVQPSDDWTSTILGMAASTLTNYATQAWIAGTNWTAHVSRTITSGMLSNWDAAYVAGTNWLYSVAYRTTVSDTNAWHGAAITADAAVPKTATNGWTVTSHADLYPRNNPSNYITVAQVPAETDSIALSALAGWTNRITQAYDAGTNWLSSTARTITGTMITSWNAAYDAGTNWTASVARRITAADTNTWHSALQAEADPVWDAWRTNAPTGGHYAISSGSLASIETPLGQAATAHGWGNHAIAGYLNGLSVSGGILTVVPGAAPILGLSTAAVHTAQILQTNRTHNSATDIPGDAAGYHLSQANAARVPLSITNNQPGVTLSGNFYAVANSTNRAYLAWWAVSNRFAVVQVIGTKTNVTFVSP